MRSAVHLRVVRDEPESGSGAGRGSRPEAALPDGGELSLVALLFLLSLLPVAGDFAGIGRWSPGVVGFAAVGMLLAGRELWSQLRARVHSPKGHAGAA